MLGYYVRDLLLHRICTSVSRAEIRTWDYWPLHAFTHSFLPSFINDMPSTQPRRSFLLLLILVSTLLSFTFVYHFRNRPIRVRDPLDHRIPVEQIDLSEQTLRGEVIAPKLGNETLKYVGDDPQGKTKDMSKQALPFKLTTSILPPSPIERS